MKVEDIQPGDILRVYNLLNTDRRCYATQALDNNTIDKGPDLFENDTVVVIDVISHNHVTKGDSFLKVLAPSGEMCKILITPLWLKECIEIIK